jgi:hypothetical protein
VGASGLPTPIAALVPRNGGRLVSGLFAARSLDVDRMSSGEPFVAVEQQFFEQGLKLEAEITAETQALREAADQPEGPRQRKAPSVLGKVVVLVVVVAGVSLIGHRWFSGGTTPTRVAVADSPTAPR